MRVIITSIEFNNDLSYKIENVKNIIQLNNHEYEITLTKKNEIETRIYDNRIWDIWITTEKVDRPKYIKKG